MGLSSVAEKLDTLQGSGTSSGGGSVKADTGGSQAGSSRRASLFGDGSSRATVTSDISGAARSTSAGVHSSGRLSAGAEPRMTDAQGGVEAAANAARAVAAVAKRGDEGTDGESKLAIDLKGHGKTPFSAAQIAAQSHPNPFYGVSWLLLMFLPVSLLLVPLGSFASHTGLFCLTYRSLLSLSPDCRHSGLTVVIASPSGAGCTPRTSIL